MAFSSIVGHSHLIELLRTAVARDRVPQSLLFAGPDGVGKRTVAIALAQALNCPAARVDPSAKRRAPSADACGTCPTCRRIAAGQHTDVAIIERGDEASIKIKHIRDRVLDVVGYRPFEARRRVFIIDQADDMGWEAQDALLKTLEEPPPSAVLILVTAFPDTLLATIQSRCRRLRFGVLSDADVARVLESVCKIEAPRARLMAASGGGSVARALEEEAGDVADDREAALELLQASGNPRIGARLKASAALAQHKSKRRDREALSARLALLASLCRDVAAVRCGAAAVVSNGDIADALADLGRVFDLDRLSRAFTTIIRAQQALDRNASPKIVADWVGTTI
jgi:DNA polymerase-3 subunit delta'